jgi:uncharacterized hydrophobic protein (TIGR00271 family)
MINFITDLLNLHKGEESKQKTLDNVKSNISFTGSNLWILACAIMIASVGLNVNSTAVIIGAMLISPLMGPIVGAGFALGIYDFGLLRKSLGNLLIATIASLLVATIYFYLSPFKEVQSELLARTSPNIYDVLIAFFGGLAGVIAITRVEKGNPIPGVAIATALMPPLCTAGYGLATANWKFFLGALFLYGINCVFICIATFSIVKYLNYPASKQPDIKHQKQVRYGITALIILILLPSTYFAFALYKEQKFRQAADSFIEHEFVDNGNTLVFKKINYNAKSVELAFLKKAYTEAEVRELNKKLQAAGLKNSQLIIRQNSSENIQSLKSELLGEINKKDNTLSEKDKNIALLEQKLGENSFNNQQLLVELNVFFPSIRSVSVSRQQAASKDSLNTFTAFIYSARPSLNETDKDKLKSWMVKKLNVNNIKIIETDK